MHGQFCFVGKQLSEGLCLLGLPALIPGEVKRVADDDFLTTVFPGESRQRSKILARAFADQSQDRLRGYTQTVGHGDSNTAISDVQAQNSRYCALFHKCILRNRPPGSMNGALDGVPDSEIQAKSVASYNQG